MDKIQGEAIKKGSTVFAFIRNSDSYILECGRQMTFHNL
jgi:hypothetical protein